MLNAGPKGLPRKPIRDFAPDTWIPPEETRLNKYGISIEPFNSLGVGRTGQMYWQVESVAGRKYWEIDLGMALNLGMLMFSTPESAFDRIEYSLDGVLWHVLPAAQYDVRDPIAHATPQYQVAFEDPQVANITQPSPAGRYWRVYQTLDIVSVNFNMYIEAVKYDPTDPHVVWDSNWNNGKQLSALGSVTHTPNQPHYGRSLEMGGQPDLLIIGEQGVFLYEPADVMYDLTVDGNRKRANSTDWGERFNIAQVTKTGVRLCENMWGGAWTLSTQRTPFHPNVRYSFNDTSSTSLLWGYAMALKNKPSQGVVILKVAPGTTSTPHGLAAAPDFVFVDPTIVLHKDASTYALDGTARDTASPTRASAGWDVTSTHITHPSLSEGKTIFCLNHNTDARVAVNSYTGTDPTQMQLAEYYGFGLVMIWRVSPTAPTAGEGGAFKLFGFRSESHFPNGGFMVSDNRGHPSDSAIYRGYMSLVSGTINLYSIFNVLNEDYVYVYVGYPNPPAPVPIYPYP